MAGAPKTSKKEVKSGTKRQKLGAPDRECDAFILATQIFYDAHKKKAWRLGDLSQHIAAAMTVLRAFSLCNRTAGSLHHRYHDHLASERSDKMMKKWGTIERERAVVAIHRAGGVAAFLESAAEGNFDDSWWDWELKDGETDIKLTVTSDDPAYPRLCNRVAWLTRAYYATSGPYYIGFNLNTVAQMFQAAYERYWISRVLYLEAIDHLETWWDVIPVTSTDDAGEERSIIYRLLTPSTTAAVVQYAAMKRFIPLPLFQRTQVELENLFPVPDITDAEIEDFETNFSAFAGQSAQESMSLGKAC